MQPESNARRARRARKEYYAWEAPQDSFTPLGLVLSYPLIAQNVLKQKNKKQNKVEIKSLLLQCTSTFVNYAQTIRKLKVVIDYSIRWLTDWQTDGRTDGRAGGQAGGGTNKCTKTQADRRTYLFQMPVRKRFWVIMSYSQLVWFSDSSQFNLA